MIRPNIQNSSSKKPFWTKAFVFFEFVFFIFQWRFYQQLILCLFLFLVCLFQIIYKCSHLIILKGFLD